MNKMPEFLFHLAPKEQWGEEYLPSTYDIDGFIHLTKEISLLLEVANHFYKASPGEWIVLCIDQSKLSSEVRFKKSSRRHRHNGHFNFYL